MPLALVVRENKKLILEDIPVSYYTIINTIERKSIISIISFQHMVRQIF